MLMTAALTDASGSPSPACHLRGTSTHTISASQSLFSNCGEFFLIVKSFVRHCVSGRQSILLKMMDRNAKAAACILAAHARLTLGWDCRVCMSSFRAQERETCGWSAEATAGEACAGRAWRPSQNRTSLLIPLPCARLRTWAFLQSPMWSTESYNPSASGGASQPYSYDPLLSSVVSLPPSAQRLVVVICTCYMDEDNRCFSKLDDVFQLKNLC